MSIARVTSKGQVTIPVEIRRALSIREGDDLVFEQARQDSVRFRVLRQRPLTSLAGALPAKRPYPGKGAIREEVARERERERIDRSESRR